VQGLALDGILNISKPKGITSFKVVARVKRLTGEKRAGHAGTLDPEATGALPVCLGQGTRIIEYFMATTKTYRARIEFGTATDTGDSTGRITRRGDVSGLNRRQVVAALDNFRGTIEQTPPMYSAVKYHGQPLYKLARAGITVARKSRTAVIHRLELLSWRRPVANIEVECGKGTYIRTLADDLGEYLGCCAHLKNLVRTRYGCFNIEDAISIPHLEAAIRCGYWQQFLHPIDIVMKDFPAIVFDEAAEEAFKTGMPVNPVENDASITDPSPRQPYCRAYSSDGRFLGILRQSKSRGVWKPKKVFV
jgi:tRNA pseudouridine55 synthase